MSCQWMTKSDQIIQVCRAGIPVSERRQTRVLSLFSARLRVLRVLRVLRCVGAPPDVV